jgi:hypothetical protein
VFGEAIVDDFGSIVKQLRQQKEKITKLENEVIDYQNNQFDPSGFINYSFKIQYKLNTRHRIFHEKVQLF